MYFVDIMPLIYLLKIALVQLKIYNAALQENSKDTFIAISTPVLLLVSVDPDRV